MDRSTYSRRRLLSLAGCAIAAPSLLRAESASGGVVIRNKVMSFTSQDWRDHFDTLGRAVIIADITSRALHFWSGDGHTHRIFPTSVPRTDALAKRGYTQVVRKKVDPDWTPTASMVARNPDLKYLPPGPANPLGTHAMYLGWANYLIHGTHDARKIGRPSSDGCIGLYNSAVAELFALVPVGTQVRIL